MPPERALPNMINRYTNTYTFLVIACLVFIRSTNIAGARIDVDIHLHKQKLLIGEPLLITTEISNNGDRNIEIPWYGGTYYSNDRTAGKVVINGKDYNPDMDSALKPIHKRIGVLKPGDSMQEKFILLNDWEKQQYLFNTPGTYEVQIQYGALFTHTKEVQVSEPVSEVDQYVWNHELRQLSFEYVRLVRVPWQVNTRLSIRDQERTKFLKLSEQYKDSTYVPYILFSLARNCRARSVASKKNTMHHKERARTLLNSTQKRTDNPVFEQFIRWEMKQLRSDQERHDDLWIGWSTHERVSRLQQDIKNANLSEEIRTHLLNRLDVVVWQLQHREASFPADASQVDNVNEKLSNMLKYLETIDGQLSDEIAMDLRMSVKKIISSLPVFPE